MRFPLCWNPTVCAWAGTAVQRLHWVPRDGYFCASSEHPLLFRTGLYQKEGHVSGVRGQICSDSPLKAWNSTQESQGGSSRVNKWSVTTWAGTELCQDPRHQLHTWGLLCKVRHRDPVVPASWGLELHCAIHTHLKTTASTLPWYLHLCSGLHLINPPPDLNDTRPVAFLWLDSLKSVNFAKLSGSTP